MHNRERLLHGLQTFLAESEKVIPSQLPPTLHFGTEAGVSLGPVDAQLALGLDVRDGAVESQTKFRVKLADLPAAELTNRRREGRSTHDRRRWGTGQIHAGSGRRQRGMRPWR